MQVIGIHSPYTMRRERKVGCASSSSSKTSKILVRNGHLLRINEIAILKIPQFSEAYTIRGASFITNIPHKHRIKTVWSNCHREKFSIKILGEQQRKQTHRHVCFCAFLNSYDSVFVVINVFQLVLYINITITQHQTKNLEKHPCNNPLQVHFALCLFDFGWREITCFPNMAPQKPQPANLGEGGSLFGVETTLSFRYACPFVVVDGLRSIKPIDPTLRDGLSSLNSATSCCCCCCCFCWVVLILFKSPDINRSFQTNPEDPCLLKDVVDLCNPAISVCLCEMV